MKKIDLFLVLLVLSAFSVSAQSVSPLVIKDFKMQSNEIIDIEKIPEKARADMRGNAISRIKVRAVGFNESLVQSFVFISDGIEITDKSVRNGQVYLHVSSNTNGSVTIKYKGDCIFTLPYRLEAGKVYELTVSMETATLIIMATPEEAEIFVDDENVGKGYASVAVSLGAKHHYKVQCPDFVTKENDIVFSKSGKKEIDIELEPTFGYITVMSQPLGAEVSIDGVVMGRTPYQCERISAGQHKVVLKRRNYKSSEATVTVKEGEINTVLNNVVLEAVPVTYGSLTLKTWPEGAIVSIRGRQYGRTPLKLEDVETGICNVELSKKGFEKESRQLEIKEGSNELIVKMRLVEDAPVTNDGNGVFSVGENSRVCFSKGNLQFKPESEEYRFAGHQWDTVEKDCKASFDFVSSHFYNYHTISNGGSYQWYIMTAAEWDYLLDKRTTKSGLRYAHAIVNGVKGLILLPDDWNVLLHEFIEANTYSSYKYNEISTEIWDNVLEPNGAVFLPANKETDGRYWTSTAESYNASYAKGVCFGEGSKGSTGGIVRKSEVAVRLVRKVE